jgi:2'-5' RNA ligase
MPRAFVAIDIDEAIREKLVSAQRQLKATGADLKLVEPQNIHVTMKFLGEVPDDKIGTIVEALKKAVGGTEQFDVDVHGIGAFPDLHYIRVVWAGIREGRDEIISLQRRIDQELHPLAFSKERDFVPHLTIARVRTAKAKERLAAFVREMVDAEFGMMRARALELKRSTLTQRGPVYSTLERFEFAQKKR